MVYKVRRSGRCDKAKNAVVIDRAATRGRGGPRFKKDGTVYVYIVKVCVFSGMFSNDVPHD